MKKFITIAAAAALLVIPATATAAYGTQPGWDNATSNTVCAGAGAFGAFGEQGERHDLGQGDSSPTGMLKLGADGPATGLANSGLCSSR